MSSGEGKPVVPRDIAALPLLPMALQRRIHVELCFKHLRHPLLRWWHLMDPDGARGLCHNAIEFIGLGGGDHLFFQRADAIGAYVLTIGAATYSAGKGKRKHSLTQGAFFCEAALWSKGKHKHSLTQGA